MAVPFRNSLQKGTVNTVSTVDRRTLLVIPGNLLRFAHIILGVLGNISDFLRIMILRNSKKIDFWYGSNLTNVIGALLGLMLCY